MNGHGCPYGRSQIDFIKPHRAPFPTARRAAGLRCVAARSIGMRFFERYVEHFVGAVVYGWLACFVCVTSLGQAPTPPSLSPAVPPSSDFRPVTIQSVAPPSRNAPPPATSQPAPLQAPLQTTPLQAPTPTIPLSTEPGPVRAAPVLTQDATLSTMQGRVGSQRGAAAGEAPRAFLADNEVRIRIAWGGGDSKRWSGRIVIQGAQIVNYRSIGLASNSPGSLRVSANAVQIHQQTAQSYDGVDLTLRGDLGSKLRIELTDLEPPLPAKKDEGEPIKTPPVEVELRKVVQSFVNQRLDNAGNRLLVRRQPGDWLRLNMPQLSAFYAPGAKLSFTPAVHYSSFDRGTSCRLRAELRKARGDRAIWSDERGFTADANGSAVISRAFELELPEEEGVYDLQLTASIRRFGGRFLPNQEQQRVLQVVVLGDKAPQASASSEWKLVDSFDPANPSWRQWVNRLPGVRNLPGFDPAMPLGNGKMAPIRHLGRDWVELKPGGWQAFPLPTKRLHQPHVVEVEYPADVPQSLGISVLQTNLADTLAPPHLDSGVHVDSMFNEFVDEESRTRTVRLVFWPHRASPFLMLANHQDTRAVFGKIRVYAAEALPVEQPTPNSRMTAALFEQPLFSRELWRHRGLRQCPQDDA